MTGVSVVVLLIPCSHPVNILFPGCEQIEGPCRPDILSPKKIPEYLLIQISGIQISTCRISEVQTSTGFADDYRPPGLLHAALLTSPHAHALLQAHPRPDRETIRSWLESNLCRCTGYEGIERAVAAAAE